MAACPGLLGRASNERQRPDRCSSSLTSLLGSSSPAAQMEQREEAARHGSHGGLHDIITPPRWVAAAGHAPSGTHRALVRYRRARESQDKAEQRLGRATAADLDVRFATFSCCLYRLLGPGSATPTRPPEVMATSSSRVGEVRERSRADLTFAFWP